MIGEDEGGGSGWTHVWRRIVGSFVGIGSLYLLRESRGILDTIKEYLRPKNRLGTFRFILNIYGFVYSKIVQSTRTSHSHNTAPPREG